MNSHSPPPSFQHTHTQRRKEKKESKFCRDKSELLQTTTPKKKNNFVEVNLIYVQKKKKKDSKFRRDKTEFC